MTPSPLQDPPWGLATSHSDWAGPPLTALSSACRRRRRRYHGYWVTRKVARRPRCSGWAEAGPRPSAAARAGVVPWTSGAMTRKRPSGEMAKPWRTVVPSGVAIVASNAGSGVLRNWTKESAARASIRTAVVAIQSHWRRPRAREIGGASACPTSNSMSPISRSRFFGSFSRQRLNSGRIGGRIGEVRLVADHLGRISPGFARNSVLPVTSSYSSTPNAQMSVRLSTPSRAPARDSCRRPCRESCPPASSPGS